MTKTPFRAATDRAEWLEWRRGGIGASDVAAILGLSPYASAWSVWAEKVSLTKGTVETPVMEAGRWLELAIAPWFTDRTGLYVYGAQTSCEHPDRPWMRCTVDGFVGESPGIEGQPTSWTAALGLLEIKTVARWGRWTEIPAHYQTQGQWQMAVTGLPQVWFAVLHNRQLEIYELKRDDGDIKLMTDKVSAFWHDHVLTGNPPPIDGHRATLTALTEMYPESRPGAVQSLDDVQGAVIGLRAAREDLKAARQAEDECKAIIAATLADCEEGTIDGRTVVTYRSHERHDIDVDRLRLRHPDIAERYTTVTTVRTMRTPDPKGTK